MKAHTATSPQHTATPAPKPTFGLTAHNDITVRAFDILYDHTDIAIIDVPDAGAFLTYDTALALADLIASDQHLATLITQQAELDGAA
jgi:hypothetical protein